MTINIHNLTHIVQCISRHGPYYMYICYPYESFNKILLSAIDGTYRCKIQAANTIGTYQYLSMKLKDITDESTIDTISKMDCNIEGQKEKIRYRLTRIAMYLVNTHRLLATSFTRV